mmetsp:Transcript_68/g.53  ORF Transcript_68/g.53 Transcript_68/m.53 type:complete len:86 (+) Transcript_68:171-428(+)
MAKLEPPGWRPLPILARFCLPAWLQLPRHVTTIARQSGQDAVPQLPDKNRGAPSRALTPWRAGGCLRIPPSSALSQNGYGPPPAT